ncbi:AbiV family abortive infection protein [Citricoccus muralis]|uniref:AbiV family abortive infection protein n=1 Tax=Citricoccus muralis TaxID=169134 RepID=A0ABY8H527_9MICC|nr:AbiV family abortive infection protein [Citricoccus muralis]WFP15752.1 AbiV family abortive infection protein [Citricoccus muralis]
MARRQHLPDNLSPEQVVALQDALLANADRLLRAALTALDEDDAALARSLGILGMEESGKAIALHERRVDMAHCAEGEVFVDDGLRKLWREHHLKLDIVHRFLMLEQYWFGVAPSDPEENAEVLGTIQEWKREHNSFKQRGFYVDVTPEGELLTPQDVTDPDVVRAVLEHVHQIGWQLRLGEHIEGRRQEDQARSVPPASEEKIEDMRRLTDRMDPEIVERMLKSMREGAEGTPINNAAYGFTLSDKPFKNVGRPGYEAHDRELHALWQSLHCDNGDDEEPEPPE